MNIINKITGYIITLIKNNIKDSENKDEIIADILFLSIIISLITLVISILCIICKIIYLLNLWYIIITSGVLCCLLVISIATWYKYESILDKNILDDDEEDIDNYDEYDDSDSN